MTTTYLDRLQGIETSVAVKAPVLVATTAAITLSGEQTIDGVALVAGDRVLVKDQASAIDNGIWDVSTGTWSRADDFNGARDAVRGTRIFVVAGSTNSNTEWVLTTTDPEIGVSALTFTLRGVTTGPSSIMDFGAVCDGTTDDTAAAATAIAWAIATNGSLFVPGICRLTSAITATMAAEDHISIYGVGPRNSGFLVDNLTGGIDFDGSAVRSHSVSLRNLGFFPNSDGVGYPFKIRGLEGGAQDNRAAEVINVHVGPVDDTVDYSFDEGPSVTGLFRPFFSNLIVTQGSASTTKMAHIMDVSGCYKPAWGGECYLKATAASGGADYGLIQIGDTPEDMTCLPITINGADIGWLIENTGREPGGFIAGHHINSKQKNIVIDGLKYATIFAPLLYADTSEATFIDIELINADGVQILDPIFRGNSVDNRRHVRADPTAPDLVRNIKVRAFGLYATVTVAPFYIGSEVDNCQIELPRYVSGSDFASYPTELVEVEAGAENIIVKTPTETRTYDDGATTGPLMKYVRRSASPAASDVLAEHDFIGSDSAGNEAIYAAIRAIIRDATNGSEDGALQLYAMIAGTSTQVISLEAPASDQTAMFLLINDGGVSSLKRVKKGADDSGGSGLSALVVDN